MSEGFSCVAFVNAYSLARAIMPTLQKILILPGAGAERNKEGSGLQNLSGELANKIVAFLRNQPRDYRNDRAFRFFRQTKAAQQIKFASQLTGKIIGRKIGGDVGIRFRIPKIVVHSV